MAKKFCSNEECIRCGACCTHLTKRGIFTKIEDALIRKTLFAKKGILYIYPLRKYGLGATNNEAAAMLEEAKKININLKIKPKKIIPIHTEHPEYFKRSFNNVVTVKQGEKVTL